MQLELGEAVNPLCGDKTLARHAPARHHAVEFAHENMHKRFDGGGLLEQSVFHGVIEERRQMLEVVCILPAAHLARRVVRIDHLAHPLAAELSPRRRSRAGFR